MLKRKYRVGIAAVLVGAALFSPLLCGMSCLETHGMRQSTTDKIASPARGLAAELAGGAMVGCVLTHIVSSIDFGEWADQVDVGTWIWAGIEALRLGEGVRQSEVRWR